MDITNINFESGWKIIKEEAIEKIEKYLENDMIESKKNLFSATEYTRLYTVVYNMCAKKNPYCYSKEVYRKYGEILSVYAVEKIKPLLLTNTSELEKTKTLINAWNKYSFYTTWMNKFLRYLDRYYVEYNSSLCLTAYTKKIFKITLFNDSRIYIKNIIYEIYGRLRTNENKEESVLFCNIVLLYKELDKESNEKMYESDIEFKILENVENYYKQQGEIWINKLLFDDYIIAIETSIEKEFEKNKSLDLTEETCERVTNIIVRILIYEKLNILLKNKSNIIDLLKNNNLQCLRRTYILFSYFSEAIEGLKKIIGEYVKEQGNSLKNKYIALSANLSKEKQNFHSIYDTFNDFGHQSNNENVFNSATISNADDISNNIDTLNDESMYELNKDSNITCGKNNEYILCGYIDKVIKLHNHYENVFKVCFYNISNNTLDPQFKQCLKEYFESFIEHEDENFSTVKLLVLYADNLLKKTSNVINNEDVSKNTNLINRYKSKENDFSEDFIDTNISEKSSFSKTDLNNSSIKTKGDDILLMKKMTDIVEIFNYTSNKETFFEYYRIFLANRLINNLYMSINAEKKIIEKLYYLCGSQYTSKLGGMLQDIINNNTINKKFIEYINKKNGLLKNDINIHKILTNNYFTVKILNKGYWPAFDKLSMKINNEFNKYILLFEEYYKSDTKNKKLDWVYEVSEVIIEYTINEKDYFLYCNLVNAHVFLLFNKYDFINYNIVQNELNINLKTFTDNIYSSLYMYHLIYTTDEEVNWSTSNFYINKKFNYSYKNVYIKKTTALLSKEQEKAKEDRGLAIEAAIVRVMKVHKKLFYDQIFDYVKNALSTFAPTNKVIEKKIDLLVDREYIQKEENSQLYIYIP
ncbi:cullin-1, putative [Hepatocystis sp. ex Piliocolobus tephrosceles]|nr:cullin-1, putative [Hepatocystis sp. ex Piliocolobus tephrosceles]